MNVMISAISEDLGTTVQGVQTAITLFLLVMAALMIPGGKLTDKYGRKRCLVVGLVVYGTGAVIAGFAQGLWMLILGYSILQGVGTALLIPPSTFSPRCTSPTSPRGPRRSAPSAPSAGWGPQPAR